MLCSLGGGISETPPPFGPGSPAAVGEGLLAFLRWTPLETFVFCTSGS